MDEPKSTRFDQALENIKNHKILSSVLIVGVIVIAIGSFTEALTKISAFFPDEPAQLEIADILVSPMGSAGRKLDVRVVNNTDKTITISRLRLEALSYKASKVVTKQNNAEEDVMRVKAQSYEPVTAEYSVDLNELKKVGQDVEIPVAHTLEAGKSDRFTVTVGMKPLSLAYRYTWSLDPELTTNIGEAHGPVVSIELP